MTVMDHINRLVPRELGAWLKERLADEMPLLCMRLEETTAQSIIKSYEREMPPEIKRVLVLACVELVREFMRTPDAATDYYAEELMRLACGIAAPVSDEAHMLVAQSTFAALSKAKQVAVLSIVRKTPHEYTYWTELDRRTDGKLLNVIASCILGRGLAEFIRFMPKIADVPVDTDLLMILLQMRINGRAAEEKAQLLQLIREVLPQCCASIRRAVAEWFHEERIPGANVDGSHVSMSAGMGAMCGADDEKTVYDGSVSLSYADGREIGCAKCRELFVADVKRKPPTYPTPKGTST